MNYLSDCLFDLLFVVFYVEVLVQLRITQLNLPWCFSSTCISVSVNLPSFRLKFTFVYTGEPLLEFSQFLDFWYLKGRLEGEYL